jgi:acyl-CoA synthetase (AMP-forming)/AMP-acid ligase II
MACTLHVAWDDRLTGYDFGPGHPLAPARVELTIELARAFGLFAAEGCRSSARRPPLTRNLGWCTSSLTSLRCGGRAARSRRVEFVDEIPKGPYGKVLRRILLERDQARPE